MQDDGKTAGVLLAVGAGLRLGLFVLYERLVLNKERNII